MGNDTPARFIVGIDLGTSNCAMAWAEPSKGANAKIVDFPVTQLVRAGEALPRPLYPSAIYLPIEGEFPSGAIDLPWGQEPRVSGELARWQGARVPGRVITSAKSWLIHPGVDRQAPILPWGAPIDVPRLSPVQAQAAFLQHMARAWDAANPTAPLAQQDVVLTIPASFDEAARALTLQAARDAGFELNRLTLLEEPQAAFYDFTARHRKSLAKALKNVTLVLVVDVGGGTTDFSLVQVAMLPEGPALRRIAVGDHVLLGGDNMDATLARALEAKLFSDGRRLSATQWTQAVQQARQAKEALLSSTAADRQPIVIASQGSRLLGGTLSTELTRAEVEALIVEGFFPAVSEGDLPKAAARGGVVELGLPYAADPAITRHVVAFLKAHAAGGHAALAQASRSKKAPPTASGLPRPDAILLNGGVFNSQVLTQALVKSLSALWPDSPALPILPHDSLDLAVARGAAYSGLARRALGQKIGGGAPRAFYAVVGTRDGGGKQGVCLVPRGLEEGSTLALESRTFSLTLGKPVQFQLYATTADRLDKAGDVVSLDDEAFKALPPIHTVLQGTKGTAVTVSLQSTLSEVGTLAVSCVSGAQRWRLEFELRGAATASELTVTESMPARFSEATLEVDRVFGTKPLPVEPRDVKNLFRTLERVLGAREGWTIPILRELWTSLFAGVSKRRRSPDHERVFFQLLGYSLRPGFGYPLDEWRGEQTGALIKEGVTHHQEQPVWAEFWVLFRRIAGGLREAEQLRLWDLARPQLARKVPVGVPPPKEKLKGIQPQAIDEMVRCAASLELLPAEAKLELGGWIGSRLTAPDTVGGPWAWSLGRLGARVPTRAAGHRLLAPTAITGWIELLLTLDPKRHDGALFALMLLTRKTGDRAIDVDEPLRSRVLAHFGKHDASAGWKTAVSEVTQLSADDEARALGDTLPVGLTLE